MVFRVGHKGTSMQYVRAKEDAGYFVMKIIGGVPAPLLRVDTKDHKMMSRDEITAEENWMSTNAPAPNQQNEYLTAKVNDEFEKADKIMNGANTATKRIATVQESKINLDESNDFSIDEFEASEEKVSDDLRQPMAKRRKLNSRQKSIVKRSAEDRAKNSRFLDEDDQKFFALQKMLEDQEKSERKYRAEDNAERAQARADLKHMIETIEKGFAAVKSQQIASYAHLAPLNQQFPQQMHSFDEQMQRFDQQIPQFDRQIPQFDQQMHPFEQQTPFGHPKRRAQQIGPGQIQSTSSFYRRK